MSQTKAPIPITALCGFLGSGKTTLMRQWRRDATVRDAVVIVHDLSEFGLDAELLAGETSTPPVPGRLVGRVAALHGEHARELLHASAGKILAEVAELDSAPPLVLCESTGAARPWPLIQALTQNPRFSLRHFVVTVDALNLHRDFGDGRLLAIETSGHEDPALGRAAETLAEQIAFASLIVLTKVDTVPQAVVDLQTGILGRLRPTAAIAHSSHGALPRSLLDGSPAPNVTALRGLAEALGIRQRASTADDIEYLVVRDRRPFHPQRLYEACQRSLGTGLYRTKGYVWLASRPGDVLLWQQSGSQITLELTGYWRAEVALNRDGELLVEEAEQLRERLKSQHPTFGDRHVELTLIGMRAACEGFAAALREAFCTEEEVAAWQRGEAFADPWPKKLRHVG